MQLPLQISFRNLDRSEAIEARIRELAEKLDQFHEQIMSCRVMVEAPHKHRHKGNLYHVRLDVKVPGNELVASREADLHRSHEDIYVAIRDAFDAMRRQLEDHARRRRQDVKTHDVPPHGRISELVPEQDFGRLITPDGREIYFHRNSVVGSDFDQMEVGMEVRFDEVAGDQGPQASTVKVVGKHHIVS